MTIGQPRTRSNSDAKAIPVGRMADLTDGIASAYQALIERLVEVTGMSKARFEPTLDDMSREVGDRLGADLVMAGWDGARVPAFVLADYACFLSSPVPVDPDTIGEEKVCEMLREFNGSIARQAGAHSASTNLLAAAELAEHLTALVEMDEDEVEEMLRQLSPSM